MEYNILTANYKATISPGRYRYRVYQPIRKNMAMDFSNYASQDSVTTEYSIQIDVPENEYNRMQADILAFNKMKGEYYDAEHWASVVFRQEEEKRIRRNNPTVAQAYEKYMSLVRLVGNFYE